MTASRTLMGTAARASLATAFMACGATADFTGLSTEANLVDQTGWASSDARTLYVISVFANFDNAADQLIAVFGDANHVLSVETSDDVGFWQFDGDGSGAPGDYNTSNEIAAALSGLYASVTSDSFVTIGLTDSTGNALQNIGMDFTSFNDASISSAITVDNGSWFITPDDPQGTAGNYTDNRVLIGQFTVGEGEDVTGSVSLQWRDDVGITSKTYAATIDGVALNVKDDMNGDGISDVLWRGPSATGDTIYTWMVDASNPADLTYDGYYLFNTPGGLTGWVIAGTGDFDGDGLSDILWQDPQNRIYVWKLRWDPSNPAGPVYYEGDWLYELTNLATWSIESTGDMNGDGISDVLWRGPSATGDIIYTWMVDASNPANLTYDGYYLYNTPGGLTGWVIADTGDFDGDGLSDILWQDPQNRIYVWKLRWDPSNPAGPVYYEGDWLYELTNLATWSIESTGDMNGDGISDVLWRGPSATGDIIYTWMVDASNPANLTYDGYYLYNTPGGLTGWVIASTGDFDGDGLSDILWQDPSNRIYVWKLRWDLSNPAGPVYYEGDWLYELTNLATWSIENGD